MGRSTAQSTLSGGPSKPAFVPALEGLRGYAAVLVVVYHCWLLTHLANFDGGPGRALLSTGFFGLNFFFVLSGFVLMLPTAARGSFGSVGSYAARRAARIVPAYYLSIAIALLALPLIAASADAARESVNAGSLVAHLTFMQTEARLIPGYDSALGFAVNPVLWTLSVEAAFYALLPLVARRYSMRPLLGLAAAVIVAAGCRFALTNDLVGLGPGDTSQALSLMPLFGADFAIGMTGACLYIKLRESSAVRSFAPYAAVLLACALVASMLWAGNVDFREVRPHVRHSILLSTLVPVVFGLLALACTLCSRRAQWPVSNALARWLGKVSYGTYLFHFLVIGFAINTLGLESNGSNAAFYTMTAFALPASLALGWLSYVGVEQPARRWVRRWLERRRPAPEVLVGAEVSPRRSPA